METNEIDWEIWGQGYDHWLTGNLAIKHELLRIAQMGYAGGTANAEWIKKPNENDLSLDFFNEASFAAVLHAKLQEQVSSMKAKSLRNPFMAQPYTSDLSELAHRFARAYLTATSTDNVLPALQKLDVGDEKVRFLIDAVYQHQVKQQLINISELGYESWTAKSKELSGSYSTSKDEGKLSVADTNSNLSASTKPVTKKRVSLKPTRAELLQKVHGFPWQVSTKTKTLNQLQALFIEEELIDPSMPEDQFAAIFNTEGPEKPIQILKDPGKLVIIFRWLSEQVLLLPQNLKDLDLEDAESLKKLGYWLNPRLAGTFVDRAGERFTTRQLTKAASHLMKEVRDEAPWYQELDKRLKEASSYSS